ncbi:DUF1801 domain-containing protein [Sulfurimonas sp.]|uniref:DUF1801 domain-containing protein n=1 Tax=Sulfurimonas sp. TaxID=2022749 RepID=UPI003D0CA335
MKLFKNIAVKEKFNTYPEPIKQKLLHLRELIYEVAKEEKSITAIEETLKWDEPSYITKNGSTLRINWKKKTPHQYSMYFNCQTKLVPTFRELFSDRFHFEGNREIVFQEDEVLDEVALKYCILLSLTYHDRKHLDMLDE